MVGRLVTRERRVWRILSCMSTHYDMRSFIVWAEVAEREKARKVIRRWREPRATVMPVTCRDKVKLRIARRYIGKRSPG
jgi:hypothetical protein